MSQVKIEVRHNGPYKITGAVEIVNAAGESLAFDASEPVFLCRCGQSADKPFCDGTHKRCEFRPDGENPF